MKKHVAILNQSLEWAGGVVYCICCGNQRIKQLKNTFRHTQLEGHKRSRASFSDKKNDATSSKDVVQAGNESKDKPSATSVESKG